MILKQYVLDFQNAIGESKRGYSPHKRPQYPAAKEYWLAEIVSDYATNCDQEYVLDIWFYAMSLVYSCLFRAAALMK